jgi:hypothetical protein
VVKKMMRIFRLSVGLQRDMKLWRQMCRPGGKALEQACLVIAVVLMVFDSRAYTSTVATPITIILFD